MKLSSIALIVILSFATAFLTSRYLVPSRDTVASLPTTAEETAFDRITKTNTLRCGYAIATPWFWIDMKTNQPTGVGYDMTNAIAAKIGLKVDWVEETGWGVMGRCRARPYNTSLRYVVRQRVY
jgi:ABC-type amino acid transport substrate-binding protein